MMQCSRCRANLTVGSLFCGQCGLAFAQPVPPIETFTGSTSGSAQPAGPVRPFVPTDAKPSGFKSDIPRPLLWLIGGGFFVFILILFSHPSGSAPPATAEQSTPASTAPTSSIDTALVHKPPLNAPVYKLASSEDCTVDADEPCRRISIVVPKGQSKAQIATDLTHAAQEAAASYGTVRGIAFASAEGTDMNGPYSAGRAEWGPHELTDRPHTADAPSIDYVEDYFKPETPPPASVKRISEVQRKRIYYEIGLSEDKATHDADAQYPTDANDNAEQIDQSQRNVMPNAKMSNDLTEKYHARVQKRYHLSDAQFSAILGEGEDKHWPTPDPTKD